MSSKRRSFSRVLLNIVLLASLALSACQPSLTPAPPTATNPPAPIEQATQPLVSAPPAGPAATQARPAGPVYKDASAPAEARVKDLLSRMTLDEKIGQMTQVEKNGIQPDAVAQKFIGSVLSGGGGYPQTNTPEAWYAMVSGFQNAALKTHLGIPILYGVDAVHGHNNVKGAVIYPHEVGLGATRNADLVQRIGRATAEEVAATGIAWDFAPVVAVVQDIRWGRVYEGYGENTGLVIQLSHAYIQGLQNGDPAVMATPKHFIGDGGTKWGTATTNNYKIDQGDTQMDEAALRSLFLPPYQDAVDNGALSVMASFSSWNGLKMPAQKHLLTDVLKGELGFKGFIVSDWGGIDQVNPDYYQAVVTAINAGIDMNMVPDQYDQFINTLKQAVQKGDISPTRIDDAVGRILYAKFKLGLFEHPLGNKDLLSQVGSDAHRQLAREAVTKSLVLLQNKDQALPLPKDAPTVFVAGDYANDIGVQCGGWTIEWQGKMGASTDGTTILDAVKAAVSKDSQVFYDSQGRFDQVQGAPATADVGIVVVGEQPYAEGVGDKADLTLPGSQQDLIAAVRARVKKLVVVQISGRPLVITDLLPKVDAWVAAWLPGSEGEGITDAIFGDKPFSGKLPYTWPRSNDQLPFDFKNLPTGDSGPLFPYGFGLETK